MKNPIERIGDGGGSSWVENPGDKYVVTGVDTGGKRFSLTYGDWWTAKYINLHRGNRWLLRAGKRWLINSVWN